MTTVTEKYRALVNRLYDKTVDKGINWTQESGGPGVVGQFGSFSIRLVSVRTSNNNPLEVVEVFNSEGSKVDRFNDETIGGEGTRYPSLPYYYDLMKELRKTAQRQASGADSAIDDILKELDK